MDSQHLLLVLYFFLMQAVLVLVLFNIRGTFHPPQCPLNSPTLANPGQNHIHSVWYYEHVFDHQPARLRILTEKEGAAPLRSSIAPKEREITIVSGTTRERLPAVESTAMTWGGAFALAVYVLDEADIPSVYRQVEQMHARIEARGRCRLDIVIVKESDCPKAFMRNLYPVNGMRNVAWRMASTNLILLLDADFKPSPRMHEILTEDERAYQELERKVIQESHLFVVPAFEFMPSNRPKVNFNSLDSQWNFTIPETKEDLKKRWYEGNVDCFHCSFSPAGHEPTNFRKFFDPSTTTPYSIPYVNNFEPYLLVGRESTPMYDERFRGYGKNKISQIYSCVHGHDMQLQVLPTVFVFEIPHPQSYSRKSYMGGQAKAIQNVNLVEGLYRRFTREVNQMKARRERMALEGSSTSGTLIPSQ